MGPELEQALSKAIFIVGLRFPQLLMDYLDKRKVLILENILDDQKSLLEAIMIEYERFKDFFKSKLTIAANVESVRNGRPLIWNQNGNNVPTMQLFVSEESGKGK